MLALTRKKGESLVINNNIEITVLELRGDQIKLGITAPKDVPIYRKEVYLQIQEENKASISTENAEALKTLLGDAKA
ncbi:MAG: carbon storage regulator CsrA [Agathobacter sp.]|nr:carbon storage regulator CsrA [Agathobacter sp.]